MPAFPRPLAALTGLGLVASALATVSIAGPAQAASNTLVINEVYAGAGSPGAVRQRDYVELLNVSGGPIDLQGMSLQTRAPGATGVATTVYPLPPTQLPNNGTFLVAGVSGPAGSAIPAPDATSGLSFVVNTGQVWLADTTEPIDPNTRPGFVGGVAGDDVVDFYGWGNQASSFEGSRGPGTGTMTSAQRKTNVDNDNNMTDFQLLTPTPAECGCTDAPDTATVTVDEIQGAGVTSPRLYDNITTTGRVTAVYQTGGLNGFFLQSGDVTPNASDAIFVAAGTSLGNGQYPAVGEPVRVTGQVREVGGETQLVIDAATDIVDETTGVPTVTPLAVTDWADLQDPADRERHEGELLDVDAIDFTVTDLARSHRYAEIGLAQGASVLSQPVESGATVAANARKAITLDDGATTDYAPNSRLLSQPTALPWLTRAQPARIGTGATFQEPVILDHRVNGWRFQPTQRIVGTSGSSVVTFTGTRPAAPAAVPSSQVRLASFDVGNWFTTTGPQYVAGGADRACSYIRDRLGVATMNTCTPAGPRGAADATSRLRQRQKLAAAINGLGAAIVGLQGVENSARFGHSRDTALADLVAGLNAAAGSPVWDYVASPATIPAGTDAQVVRTAFIYKPAIVRPVGPSVIMSDPTNAFSTAVEPLAQRFARAFAVDGDAVTVIVNQFTSRQTGTDDGTGQGLGNAQRENQAAELAVFAADQAPLANRVFLIGNLNTYGNEDPFDELGGFDRVAGTAKPTYVAAGRSGSLDHVLANNAAEAIVPGGDVWNVNSPESLAFQYARSNAYVTNLVDPASPFASSDHNPVFANLDMAIPPTVASTVAATMSPSSIRAGSGRASINVTVGSTPQATGSVRAYLGTTELRQATLSAGKATLPVGPFPTAGNRTIRIVYSGGPGVGASSRNVVLKVVRARPAIKVRKAPARVFVKKTKARLVTTLRAPGLTPTGRVTATLKGKRLASRTLRAGKATLVLPKFKKGGRAVVIVTYTGSSALEKVTRRVVIKVKKRK